VGALCAADGYTTTYEQAFQDAHTVTNPQPNRHADGKWQRYAGPNRHRDGDTTALNRDADANHWTN
jgi:hypothetical protein